MDSFIQLVAASFPFDSSIPCSAPLVAYQWIRDEYSSLGSTPYTLLAKDHVDVS